MTFFTRAPFAALLWASTACAGLAAQATPEGAAHLTEVFQRYLGNTEGVVTVAPDGDSYAVTLDAAPLAKKFAATDTDFSLSPQHMTLTDQGDGIWKVAQNEPLNLRILVPNVMDATMQAGSATMEGIFDEKLVAFTSYTWDMTEVKFDQKVAAQAERPSQDISYQIASVHSEFSGQASLTGGLDGTLTSVHTGLTETVVLGAGPDNPAGITIEVTGEKIDQTATLKGLRSAPIMDLLAFFVAHPSEVAVTTAQEDLRGKLQAGLPFFDAMKGTVAYSGLSVTTPFGGGQAASVGVDLDVNGLVADGHLREKFTFSGLALDEGLVPDWAKGLVPTDLSFDVAGSGFNLADPVKAMITAFDLKAEKPLPDTMGPQLLAALVPNGKFDVTFAPGKVVAPLYTLDFEGSATIPTNGLTLPSGMGTVKATGMDAVIEAVNRGPAEVGQNVGMALSMARGIAKPGGVGELIWKLDGTVPGTFKINDLDLSALSGMMGD